MSTPTSIVTLNDILEAIELNPNHKLVPVETQIREFNTTVQSETIKLNVASMILALCNGTQAKNMTVLGASGSDSKKKLTEFIVKMYEHFNIKIVKCNRKDYVSKYLGDSNTSAWQMSRSGGVIQFDEAYSLTR